MKSIILQDTIQTRWTSDKTKPYHIHKLCVDCNGNIQAWQGVAFKYQAIQFLKDFELHTIYEAESSLLKTIKNLKIYRVEVLSQIEVKAASPQIAQEMICSNFNEYLDHLHYLQPTGIVSEI